MWRDVLFPGAIAALSLAALPLAAGCCSTDYRLEDMAAKNLETAFNTLDYFRYAVRLEAWGAVYECLASEDKAYLREQYGLDPTVIDLAAFGSVLSRRTVEDFSPHAPAAVRELPLLQFIHRAETWNVLVEPPDPKTGRPRKGIALVYLYYAPLDPEAFVLVKEKGPAEKTVWRVSILEWLRRRSPQAASQPAPAAGTGGRPK
jgi:hypothetical protein